MNAQAPLGLVGDIGGTNARLAIASLTDRTIHLTGCRSFPRKDFAGIKEVIDLYKVDIGSTWPTRAAIASAGPVKDGKVRLTNGTWSISEDILTDLGFASAEIVNDYAALALAIPHLRSADAAMVGADCPGLAGEPVGILGAGTGLGVALLTRDAATPRVIATEAGHVAFAPDDEVDIEALRLLTRRFGRVSIERLLSGPGLSNLHWALGTIGGAAPHELAPEEITRRAESRSDALCVEVLNRFCDIYGRFAGDLALAFGARGGIYLAGGIAPRILASLRAGGFRRSFEHKGRFLGYVSEIPTRVITHPYAALLGAAETLARAPGGPRRRHHDRSTV